MEVYLPVIHSNNTWVWNIMQNSDSVCTPVLLFLFFLIFLFQFSPFVNRKRCLQSFYCLSPVHFPWCTEQYRPWKWMTLNAIDLQMKEIREALLRAKCCIYVFSFHSHRSIYLLQIRKLKPERLLVCYILFKIICKNKNHKSLLLSNPTVTAKMSSKFCKASS